MALEHTLGKIGRQIDTGVQKTTEVVKSIKHFLPKHPLRVALGTVVIVGGLGVYSKFVHSNGGEQVSTAPITRLTPKDLATPVTEITPTIDGQTQHILVFAETSPTEQPIPTPLFTDLLTPTVTVTGTPTADSAIYDGDNTNIARTGDSKICATTEEAITFLQQNDLFMSSLETMVGNKKIAEIKVGAVEPWSGADGSIKMAYRQGNQVNWENAYISHRISTTNVAAKSYSANQELFRKYIVVTEDKDGKKDAAEIEVQADCRCGNGVITEAVPSPIVTFTETLTATATSTASSTPDNTAVNTPKPPTKPAPTETPPATEAPTQLPVPTFTPKVVNTPTPIDTVIPTETATEAPTQAPVPTFTPKASSTPGPTVLPTVIATEAPTQAPVPTYTPNPTKIPSTHTPIPPSSTPKPTVLPPTATEAPTQAPVPTFTPKPTKIPAATATAVTPG